MPQPLYAQDDLFKPDAAAIRLESGYKIEAVATGLSVPTTAIFDGQDLLVAESGYANTAPARIIRIKPDGSVDEVIRQGLEPPVNGLLVVDNQLFISHRGKTSVLENGELRDIITDLPSQGDHQNNTLALGPDGKIYLGQGTATNSGIVGEDNQVYGWLSEKPTIHDVPCKDIILSGRNFETFNPLTPSDNDKTSTGAYNSFGTSSHDGEVIEGRTKCNGSILRFNKDGTELEVIAWGLRNPFGLSFDKNGQLWASFHGADVRGSRPIWRDPDYLIQVKEGAWYGWPDFFDGKPVTDNHFQAPGKPQPEFLIKNHPPLEKPYLTFDSHSGVNGIAVSPGGQFGYENDIFLAMFGSFAPITTGPDVELSGFRIVRVNQGDKSIHTVATNIIPGPSYINRTGGLNRPSDVIFAPDSSLYVVDWGETSVDEQGLKLEPGTGAVWRIYNEKQSALYSSGPVVVDTEGTAEKERKPLARNIPELYRDLAATIFLFLAIVFFVVMLIVAIKNRRKKKT